MTNYKNLVAGLILLTSHFAFANGGVGEKLRQQIENQRLSLLLSLVQAHSRNVVCETDAYTSDVVRNAFSLANIWNSKKTEKIQAEIKKAEGLRKNLALNFMNIGPGPSVAEFKKAMIGSRIYGPARGVFGNTGMVDFINENEVIVWELDVDLDSPKWNQLRGTWSIAEKSGVYEITIRTAESSSLLQVDKESFFFRLHETGEIKFDTVPAVPFESSSSSPSECEA